MRDILCTFIAMVYGLQIFNICLKMDALYLSREVNRPCILFCLSSVICEVEFTTFSVLVRRREKSRNYFDHLVFTKI